MEGFLKGSQQPGLIIYPVLLFGQSHPPQGSCFPRFPLVLSPGLFSTAACEGTLMGSHSSSSLQGKLQKLRSAVAAFKPSARESPLSHSEEGGCRSFLLRDLSTSSAFCSQPMPAAWQHGRLPQPWPCKLGTGLAAAAQDGLAILNKTFFFLLPVKSSYSSQRAANSSLYGSPRVGKLGFVLWLPKSAKRLHVKRDRTTSWYLIVCNIPGLR